MENLKYFKGSFLVALIGIVAALMLGGMEALFLVAVLSVLEVSLSFDNAVVNATVLKDMDIKWRKRFLTWGILIAVFGMRIIFPVVVVSIVAGISPWGALSMAVTSPDVYAHHMEAAHVSLMGFGGTFLMMVGLDFFLDDEKDNHWIPMIETKIQSLGQYNFMPATITFGSLLLIGIAGVEKAEFKDFIIAGICGVAAYMAIHKLAGWMESREEAREENNASAIAGAAAKGGIVMFMYLEILDASFSFDGVIGAFAITTNLFIIAIGLGVGAMFVRSLTIMFVEKETLTEYEYLEHGAFYAIIALAGIMLLKSSIHVPEVITGLIGAAFIGAAFMHSIYKKKQEPKECVTESNESAVTESDVPASTEKNVGSESAMENTEGTKIQLVTDDKELNPESVLTENIDGELPDDTSDDNNESANKTGTDKA